MNWVLTLALAALGKVLPVQSGIDLYLPKELEMATPPKDDILIAIELDSVVSDALEKAFRKFGIELQSREAYEHLAHVFGEEFAEQFTDAEDA